MNSIPYIAHEGEVARLERVIKRMWILCIIMFTAFAISNGIWVYYISQFETVNETKIEQEAQADGNGNAIVNNSGELSYGNSKANDNNN